VDPLPIEKGLLQNTPNKKMRWAPPEGAAYLIFF